MVSGVCGRGRGGEWGVAGGVAVVVVAGWHG